MSTNENAAKQLAVNGGPKAFDRPFPARALFGEEEKQAAVAMFDRAIEQGEAFGYNGEVEEAYCREFAEFLGGGYADAVNSGTSAVYVALRALNIEPYTEVIVSPITDAGGVMPVPLLNCIPIVADTTTECYNVGPDEIEARITDLTSAIVVGHISGRPADMDPIMEIARSKGIFVVEDCAQTHGAIYKGRTCGTIGDVGAFSTMSGKHHATGAQGGLVFTRDKDLAQVVRRASDRGKPFGLEGVATNVFASLNLNLDDLSAAIGRVQLKKLPGIIAGRRRAALAIAEGCQALQSVRLVSDPPECEGVFWFLVFRLDAEKLTVGKAVLGAALAAEGLPVSASYTLPMTQWEWFKNRAIFGTSDLPWSSPDYKGDPNRELPLPNLEVMDARTFRMSAHERMTDEDVRDTLTALRKVENAYLK